MVVGLASCQTSHRNGPKAAHACGENRTTTTATTTGSGVNRVLGTRGVEGGDLCTPADNTVATHRIVGKVGRFIVV